MIRTVVQELDLDKISDVVANEARRVQVEVLRDEREDLVKMIARLDERIASLGGERRSRLPKATTGAQSPRQRGGLVAGVELRGSPTCATKFAPSESTRQANERE